LSYEIFFFRTISYASGSSSADFTFTLGAFLIGLASGARLTAENSQSSAKVARNALIGLLIANGIGLLFLPLLAHAEYLRLGDRYTDTAIAVLLIFMIARGWGRLLPSLAHLGITADGQTGLKTSWLYLSNIFGAALGSIVTGFVLMDMVGLVVLAQILVIAGLLCAVFLASALSMPRRERTKLYWQSAVLGALAVTSLPILSSHLLESLLWKGARDSSIPFTNVVENRSGIITVDKDSTVFGNGVYDGAFNTSLLNDRNGVIRPYALSYYNAAPRQVLQIGLASGSWAQIIANNPDVDNLTIVEINPGYLDLIAERPEVSSLLANPKVKIVIDDGRRWLRLNPSKKFDAIVSNTTYHFRANSTNLLSVEFLELIKEHLNPGGTFFYNSTDSMLVQRTGCTVFPYGARFHNHMIVSETPLAFDMKRWKKSLSTERIDERLTFDLTRRGDREYLKNLDGIGNIPYKERGKFIESCPDILARTEGVNLITDDNMGTEWRHQFSLE
jgi:spermidine synthase